MGTRRRRRRTGTGRGEVMWLTSEYERERKKLSLFAAAPSFWSSLNRASVISTHSVGGLQSPPDTARTCVCVCVYLICIPRYAPKATAMSHKHTRAKSRRSIDAVKRAAGATLEVASNKVLVLKACGLKVCHQQTCTFLTAQAFVGWFGVLIWWHTTWWVRIPLSRTACHSEWF